MTFILTKINVMKSRILLSVGLLFSASLVFGSPPVSDLDYKQKVEVSESQETVTFETVIEYVAAPACESVQVFTSDFSVFYEFTSVGSFEIREEFERPITITALTHKNPGELDATFTDTKKTLTAMKRSGLRKTKTSKAPRGFFYGCSSGGLTYIRS